MTVKRCRKTEGGSFISFGQKCAWYFIPGQKFQIGDSISKHKFMAMPHRLTDAMVVKYKSID